MRNRTDRPSRPALVCALLFTLLSTGAWAAKKPTIGPETYKGKDAKQAAAALIATAHELAADGSFENIAVGRVLYLTGSKADGQAIFDKVMAGKTKPSDWIRIARVYSEAGEWQKAKPLYDRVIEAAPKDEDWLAEVGAQYLVNGDRAHAEELFARSFAEDPSSRSNALRAAAAYLGLAPRE
jgi:tetratricopeptide (TPR) repeat protein